MSERPAEPDVKGGGMQWSSLAVGLVLMVVATANPRLLADATGRADHVLAMAVFWAMSAGFVRGVGFVPHATWIRWLFSGWACMAALVLAALIKFAH